MLIAALCLFFGGQATSTELSIEGAFREPLSGIEFPVSTGDWTRSRVFSFSEPPRLDHAVSYQLQHDLAVAATATAVVFANGDPMPDNLEVHFDATLRDISEAGRGFQLGKKLTSRFEKDGVKHEAFLALFAFRGGVGKSEEPTTEWLVLIKEDSYWIKWRVTATTAAAPTRAESDRLADRILALIQNLLPHK